MTRLTESGHNISEFRKIVFKNKARDELQKLSRAANNILPGFCQQKGIPKDSFLCLSPPSKLLSMETNKLFVEIGSKVVAYDEAFGEQNKDMPVYFIVYGNKECLESSPTLREECLTFLRAHV